MTSPFVRMWSSKLPGLVKGYVAAGGRGRRYGQVAVCVGPVCADAALAEGVTRPAWPDPPRLAAMIRLVATELGPAADAAAER